MSNGRYQAAKRPMFGRVDPFVLFAVLPLVVLAAFVAWGGLAWVGILICVVAALFVLVDSWINRPRGRVEPEYDDYDDDDDYRGRY